MALKYKNNGTARARKMRIKIIKEKIYTVSAANGEPSKAERTNSLFKKAS